MNKITFRPLNIHDAKLIFDNREFIVSYFNGGVTKKEFKSWTFTDELKFIQQSIDDTKKKKNGALTFLMFNEKKEFIGKCMLCSISGRNKNANISLSIKEKFWGQGYGTEAVQFLEKLAFSKMKLNRLGYDCYSNNLRSKKLAEKLGFKYEGRLREAKKIGNKYFDRLKHSMLKSEYKKTDKK